MTRQSSTQAAEVVALAAHVGRLQEHVTQLAKSALAGTADLESRQAIIDRVRAEKREQAGHLSRCLYCRHGAHTYTVNESYSDGTSIHGVRSNCRLGLAVGDCHSCSGDGFAVMFCTHFEDAFAAPGGAESDQEDAGDDSDAGATTAEAPAPAI